MQDRPGSFPRWPISLHERGICFGLRDDAHPVQSSKTFRASRISLGLGLGLGLLHHLSRYTQGNPLL